MDTLLHDNGALPHPPAEGDSIPDESPDRAGGTVGCPPARVFDEGRTLIDGELPSPEPIGTAEAFKPSDLAPEEAGQFGEVGVLADLLNIYGVANGWVVDVGAHDGVLYSNSLAFRTRGWSVVAIESDPECAQKLRGLDQQCYCAIEAEARPDGPNRLDKLIADVGPVPADFDVLSIDIDGYDYHVWKGMTRFTPRFVVIEVADAQSPYQGEFVPEYGAPIEESPVPRGAPADYVPYKKVTSLTSMCALAREKGYRLVGATRTNAIFVHESVLATRPLKLNLGGGGTYISGHVTVDAVCGDKVYPLPYPDGSVAEMYASHVLEHFSHRDTLKVMKEWVRVLAPGGRIKIAVPDYDKCNDPAIVPNWHDRQMYVFGGHTDRYDRHGAHFNEQSLKTQMHHCGLEWVERWEPVIQDCASYPISLNLTGVKRAFAQKETPTVCAVVSQPRLTFSTTMKCLQRALRTVQTKWSVQNPDYKPLIDDFVDCGGAFWEKYITSGIKKALEMGADYILCVDNDSVFSPEDVLALVDHLKNNPDVSAVFAVQASRHHDQALVEMPYLNYSGEATQVQLAHFGLTLIRREVFAYLPQPWLWSMPNPTTGAWDTEGHCDADITFWRVLTEYGHKIVQLNPVQAGHMVLCVKWLTEKGTIYQPVEHYEAHGKPPQARFSGSPLKARTPTQNADPVPENKG